MREELGAGGEGGHRAFRNESLEEQRENVQQVNGRGRRRKKQKLEAEGKLDQRKTNWALMRSRLPSAL